MLLLSFTSRFGSQCLPAQRSASLLSDCPWTYSKQKEQFQSHPGVGSAALALQFSWFLANTSEQAWHSACHHPNQISISCKHTPNDVSSVKTTETVTFLVIPKTDFHSQCCPNLTTRTTKQLVDDTPAHSRLTIQCVFTENHRGVQKLDKNVRRRCGWLKSVTRRNDQVSGKGNKKLSSRYLANLGRNTHTCTCACVFAAFVGLT